MGRDSSVVVGMRSGMFVAVVVAEEGNRNSKPGRARYTFGIRISLVIEVRMFLQNHPWRDDYFSERANNARFHFPADLLLVSPSNVHEHRYTISTSNSLSRR